MVQIPLLFGGVYNKPFEQGFSQMSKRAYLDCKSTVW